jgi:probable rRNA maturation factor
MNDSSVPKRSVPLEGPIVLVSNRQGLDLDEEGLVELAKRTLEREGQGGVELSLSFVGLEEMTVLHERYLGEPGPTDVLSFPMGEDGLIGDVVVCPEEARKNNTDVEAELRLLVVHGVLHLLGFDHETKEDRAEMWARQERHSGVSG